MKRVKQEISLVKERVRDNTEFRVSVRIWDRVMYSVGDRVWTCTRGSTTDRVLFMEDRMWEVLLEKR